LVNSKIPVIIAEKVDSSVILFREFDKVPNVKAVFKNRIIKNRGL